MARRRKRRQDGMTIVKLMILLGVIGVIATVIVNLIIDERCEEEPAAMLCKDRTATPSK